MFLRQLRLPQSSTLRYPTLPARRPCVCAGACSPTTRWSSTSCTTARCWRTCQRTAPVRHMVAETLTALSRCMVPPRTVEMVSTEGYRCHVWSILCSLFSKQDEGEGDPLHCDRSVAQRAVRTVGNCDQHHRHQSSQREGLIHDRLEMPPSLREKSPELWQFKVTAGVPLCAVPSPPVIKQRECTSCPEAALIRWESGNTNPVDSYTVELSEMGTDGTQRGVTE